MVDATDAELDAAIAGPGLVLVDLWAAWCGPCRIVAPILERLADRHAGHLKIVKVDVDANPAASRRFVVQGIPTIVVVRDGQVVETLVGARPEHELDAVVERTRAG